ncbi:MAG TPA: NRDE family protein [Longimicrobiaceae bacterium]|nr:NRDE family protein [Longimicrobiaceae bacterium]
MRLRGKAALTELVTGDSAPTPPRLLEILLDRAYAAEHELPATGVPRDLERALSASFISLPDYGTRSSTALLVERNGHLLIAERRYGPHGQSAGETTLAV